MLEDFDIKHPSMPSEKLKYLRNIKPRDSVFYRCFERENGEESLNVSRDHDALWVTIKHEFEGRQEISIPIGDVEELIRELQESLRRRPTA